MFENPRRGRQATKFTTNVPKILDLKSSSEQIFSENCRWVPLKEDIIWLGSPFVTCQYPEGFRRLTSLTSTVARRDKTLPRFQKHFPESKNTSQNPKHFPESRFWDGFWILGCVFGIWKVFCPYEPP